MIGVVDLQEAGGNLRSVMAAFERVGVTLQVVSERDIERCDAVVLPGVGAFGDAMRSLERQGLVEPLRRHALENARPLLGICVGMQILAGRGEEFGTADGLGLVPGRVVRLDPGVAHLRVPNIGWCDVRVEAPSVLFGEPEGATFYFAHSYHFVCDDRADAVATIDFPGPVTAAVERGSVFGVQFHPEKSQDAGLAALEAFCRHVSRTSVR